MPSNNRVTVRQLSKGPGLPPDPYFLLAYYLQNEIFLR
jgi:hypothetical protein